MWLQWCIHSSNIVRDIAIIECNVTQVALQNCPPFTRCIINFWRSFEIPLINCKVKLKSSWCWMIMLILIILVLLSKTQNYTPLQSSFQQKAIKNYQNFLRRDLKYQFTEMNIKHKVRQDNKGSPWADTIFRLHSGDKS